MILQRLWHFIGKLADVSVVLGFPVVDLVELEEDAWLASFKAVTFALSAVTELGEVNLAVFLWFDAVVLGAVDAMLVAVLLLETCGESS